MTPHDWELLRELDPAERAALAAMRAHVLERVNRRRVWWPYAAAAAILIAGFFAFPRVPPAEQLAIVIPAPRAPEVRLTPAPRPAVIAKRQPLEPFVLKLVTADPDVVIYLVSNGAAE